MTASLSPVGQALAQITAEYTQEVGGLPPAIEAMAMKALGTVAAYIDRPAEEKERLSAAAVLMLSHSVMEKRAMPANLDRYGPAVAGIFEDYFANLPCGRPFAATRDLMQLGLVSIITTQKNFSDQLQQLSIVDKNVVGITQLSPAWPGKFIASLDNFSDSFTVYKEYMTGEQPRLEKVALDIVEKLSKSTNQLRGSVRLQATFASQIKDEKYKFN